MYSLNVPVPGGVKRLAAEVHPRLVGFERVRERHSMVLKRFETDEYHRLREELRRALADTPTVEARTVAIETFDEPVLGSGPVVYLAVESPELIGLHGRLVAAFGAISGLEGDAYVPHVTLARGGSVGAAEALRGLDVDPVEWTVRELVLYDANRDERAGSFPLPFER